MPPSQRQKKAVAKTAIDGCYDRVFSSPDGRKVLLDLCKQVGITSYRPENDDESLREQFAERRLVWSIITKISMTPGFLLRQAEILTKERYEEYDVGSD